jgi:hypothetical protein
MLSIVYKHWLLGQVMDYTWEKAQDFAKTSKTSNGRPKGSQKSDFSTHLSKIFPSNLRENGDFCNLGARWVRVRNDSKI